MRLLYILVNGLLAPLWLMLALPAFGLHQGYGACVLLTLAVGSELGAILWALPVYTQRLKGDR